MKHPNARKFGVAPSIVAILGGMLVFAPPARADETATWSNLLAAEQISDVWQTSQYRGLTFTSGKGANQYAHWINEGDPLARPFVRSTFADLGIAAGVNLAIRAAARGTSPGSKLARSILRLSVIAYPFFLRNNMRSIDSQVQNRAALQPAPKGR